MSISCGSLSAKCSIENRRFLAVLSGPLDSGVNLTLLSEEIEKASPTVVIFDLRSVGSIDSSGSKKWRSFLESVQGRSKLQFRAVSKAFVDLAALMPAFLGERGTFVESVLLEYRCSSCETGHTFEIETDSLDLDERFDPPEFACPDCTHPLEFAAVEEHYFSVLKRGTASRTLHVHKFFSVNASIVEREINSGVTVSLISEVDLTEMEKLRKRLPYRPTYTTFVAKAVAMALKEFPYANRRILRRGWFSLFSTRVQQFSSSDIAIACEKNLKGIEVSTFLDVMRNAESKSLSEIRAWLHDLGVSTEKTNKQWRQYKGLIFSAPAWLAKLIISLPIFFPSLWYKWRGGAAIISSPAKYGVDIMSGSWPNPIGVSFGLVRSRPLVKNNEIVISPTFYLSVNFDRRVMAGAQAARFFKRILTILENPEKEMEYFL